MDQKPIKLTTIMKLNTKANKFHHWGSEVVFVVVVAFMNVHRVGL
jgi:hypothetical protein